MTFEKDKLLRGLQAALEVMPFTREHAAIFVLNVAVGGLELMQRNGLLDPTEAAELHQRLLEALQEAHPHLGALFTAGEPLRSAALEQMLAEGLTGDELTDRTREMMREFADDLRKPH